MKELTIEEKAKAYDEAIKRGLDYIKHTPEAEMVITRQDILEAIFPELKEPEDEKIRKDIIRVFKGEISFTSEKENEKYIAWLEKQKDVSSIERVFRPVAGCDIVHAATQAIEQQQLGYKIVLAFNGAYIPVEEKTADDIVNKYYFWIEKQAKHLENYDEAEKEKADFVGDGFVECHADFLDFKEGNTYWLEYIGDDKYNVRSDNLLGKTYHITPRQLYCLFTKQYCPKENNVNEETNGPTAYGKYVDECLNEASKHFFSEGEDKYTVADLFYAGVRCGKFWAENQSENKSDFSDLRIWKYIVDMVLTEKDGIGNYLDNPDTERIAKKLQEKYGNIEKQDKKTQGKTALEAIKEEKVDNQNCVKSADKVKPKFKTGDWIVDSIDRVKQVQSIDKYGYNFNNGDFSSFDSANETFRLWTIQDAKCGDILAADVIESHPSPFVAICKKQDGELFETYCFIGHDGKFYEGEDRHTIEGIHPATQEQRDLLFEKMKEAGYVWNVEKKELKKIDVKTVDNDEPKFHPGDWVILNNTVAQILDKQKYGFVGLDIDGKDFFCNYGHIDSMRLWTIRDAKNGDVLAEDSCIFIIQKLGDNSTAAKTYCTLHNDGDFDDGSILYFDVDSTKPATKEQRDLLFQKMKESGYEWNVEKKELKKIEHKFNIDDWIVTDDSFGKIVRHIDEIDLTDKGYVVSDEKGLIYNNISFSKEHKWHKWTIQDAEYGDVLIDEDNNIGLYLGEKDDSDWDSRIYLGCDNCIHGFNIGGRHENKNTKPASKEQRNLLFTKMKEAGYEWNAGKKELKRITKFKIGDWIVSNDGIFTGMIIEVYDYGYRDTNGYFNKCLEDNYHLWTIQDAKCGDVLISSNKQPFVYNGNYTNDSIGAYFGLTLTGELLICDSHSNNWTDLTGVQPATEEQRNMLFKKLHNSDYKWDSEKEELWHKYL